MIYQFCCVAGCKNTYKYTIFVRFPSKVGVRCKEYPVGVLEK